MYNHEASPKIIKCGGMHVLILQFSRGSKRFRVRTFGGRWLPGGSRAISRLAAAPCKVADRPDLAVATLGERSSASVARRVRLRRSNELPRRPGRGMQWIYAARATVHVSKPPYRTSLRLGPSPNTQLRKQTSTSSMMVQNFSCYIGKSAIPLNRELDRNDAELFVRGTCAERWLPVVAIS